MGGGESEVMCWKFSEVEKIECIFFNFFLYRTPQICQPKAEGDLSKGGSLLGFCVTHHSGLAIIFVGCGDCPEFLL